MSLSISVGAGEGKGGESPPFLPREKVLKTVDPENSAVLLQVTS